MLFDFYKSILPRTVCYNINRTTTNYIVDVADGRRRKIVIVMKPRLQDPRISTKNDLNKWLASRVAYFHGLNKIYALICWKSFLIKIYRCSPITLPINIVKFGVV